MFWKKDKMIGTLKMEIEDLLAELHEMDSSDPKYKEKLELFERLSDKKTQLEGKYSCWFSPDAFLSSLASILGIVLILQHEKLDVVTSKALAFVPRPNFRSKK